MTTKQIQQARGMRPDGQFPDFPPRDDMQNPIYLYDPGYPTAVRCYLGFHEDTLVQAEVPLGWHHGPRKGILIPDLMIAFGFNIASVIARRGYSILRHPGAPAFLAWVGAPRGNPRPAPGGADMECLHAMRTLAMVLLEDPDYPLDVWSSFYRAVNEGVALCGCPGQFFVLPEQMRDEREPE